MNNQPALVTSQGDDASILEWINLSKNSAVLEFAREQRRLSQTATGKNGSLTHEPIVCNQHEFNQCKEELRLCRDELHQLQKREFLICTTDFLQQEYQGEANLPAKSLKTVKNTRTFKAFLETIIYLKDQVASNMITGSSALQQLKASLTFSQREDGLEALGIFLCRDSVPIERVQVDLMFFEYVVYGKDAGNTASHGNGKPNSPAKDAVLRDITVYVEDQNIGNCAQYWKKRLKHELYPGLTKYIRSKRQKDQTKKPLELLSSRAATPTQSNIKAAALRRVAVPSLQTKHVGNPNSALSANAIVFSCSASNSENIPPPMSSKQAEERSQGYEASCEGSANASFGAQSSANRMTPWSGASFQPHGQAAYPAYQQYRPEMGPLPPRTPGAPPSVQLDLHNRFFLSQPNNGQQHVYPASNYQGEYFPACHGQQGQQDNQGYQQH